MSSAKFQEEFSSKIPALTLLMANGVDADEGLEDEALIEMVLADIQQPTNGKLEAYAPVVVNILQQWLA